MIPVFEIMLIESETSGSNGSLSCSGASVRQPQIVRRSAALRRWRWLPSGINGFATYGLRWVAVSR